MGHSVGRSKTRVSPSREATEGLTEEVIPRDKDVSKLESLGSIPGNRQGMSKAQTH